MTGEEKWDELVNDVVGHPFSYLNGRWTVRREIDAIRWAALELTKLREIIEEIRESGVCE